MSRRSPLSEILRLYDRHEPFRQQLEMYARQLEQGDHAFFRDMLLTMKGVILADVFSTEFSELGAADKDVLQRTYFHLNQWIDFLVSPLKAINEKKARMAKLANPTRGKASPN